MLRKLRQTVHDKFLGEERAGHVAGPFHASKPLLYILVVISAAIGTFGYQLRTNGIFACSAEGYTPDRYLESCRAEGYGDYDHGAFWFGLEPTAGNAVRDADVLFIGNSRMQFAFSTPATSDWFLSRAVRYYLLGFEYSEKYLFEQGLLHKLRPQAKVYVVNIDKFFEPSVSDVAGLVMHDGGALRRYQDKRLWQLIHRPICDSIPAICGQAFAVFRQRQTGVWVSSGSGGFKSEPVSEDPVIDQEFVRREAALGKDFLLRLPVKPECVILTMVPTVETQRATASALANGLKLDLLSPSVDALRTFDGSHLDPASAERWSKAFLDVAGPRIQKCLSAASGFESDNRISSGQHDHL